MLAYDIDILKRPARRGAGGDHGWCFGLPPGIAPHQWPLDPSSGHPMMHGFTILLPEDYRCHGLEIVAVSFFASGAAQDGEALDEPAGMRGTIAEPWDAPPDDPALVPFWEAARRSHPRLHRMRDALDRDYALLLLTAEEFEGHYCRPPSPIDDPRPVGTPAPRWLRIGSGAAYWERENFPDEYCAVHRVLGGPPEEELSYDRALRWRARAQDPNAGRIPRSPREGPQGDYEQPFAWVPVEGEEDRYVEKPWIEGHAANHIGGTMQPCQDVPAFSPYYIEFWETFGGYDFGSGNAQLDFRDMKIEWAC